VRGRPSVTLSRSLRIGAVAFAVLGLLGCALYLLKDNPRSFVVEAATRGVSARIDHPAMSQWLLDRAYLCLRRDRRAPGPDPAIMADAPCDTRLYEVVPTENLEIFWPAGASLRLTRTGPQSPLLVRLTAAAPEAVIVAGRELTPADLIVVPADAWLGNGPLTLAGHVVVGSLPGPGEMGNLISGSYAVSERLPLAPAPTPIASGALLSGDAVEIMVRRHCPGADDRIECAHPDPAKRLYQPSQSFGFIEPRGADDAGFGVTLYSETSDSSLAIDRFGASRIIVTPNWIHRALANPVLLGGSALLAILSGLASLGFLAPLLAWTWKGEPPVRTRPRPVFRWRRKRRRRNEPIPPPVSIGHRPGP